MIINDKLLYCKYSFKLQEMTTNNIVLFLSLDNYVYGVTETALELNPFSLIKRMVVDITYLYGIKTYCVFASSKDIEDLIILTTNIIYKPLFLKDNTLGNVVTTKTNKINVDCCIDLSHVSITTQNILKEYDKVSQSNVEDEFKSFCSNFLEDYETLRLIDQAFESIQDADMMIQCSRLLNDYVEEIVID